MHIREYGKKVLGDKCLIVEQAKIRLQNDKKGRERFGPKAL
jgi:hypothetical protein